MLSSTIPGNAGQGCRAVSATSSHPDTRTAALEIAHALHDADASSCDLILFFCSYHHAAAASEAGATIRSVLDPRHVLGCTAESILGDDQELDGVAGMSAMALMLPGVQLHSFAGSPSNPLPLSDPAALGDAVGLNDDTRAILLFADPFTTPITKLIPALESIPRAAGPIPLLGGMASGASQPGHNRLLLDDRTTDVGIAGITISGDVDLEFVVSQGCRPIGEPLVITSVEQNLITGLGGRPALDVLQSTASSLPHQEQELLERGILIGSVLDEHKARFGRGDFIVRNILGYPKDRRGIIVGEFPRAGQTIQFHVRDAKTAHEDLHLLLDVQQLQDPPFAVLLVTCNGRGKRLFGHEGHDLSIVRERLGSPPITGLFAAGEIGPIGDRSHLHGHTVALTIFRNQQQGT